MGTIGLNQKAGRLSTPNKFSVEQIFQSIAAVALWAVHLEVVGDFAASRGGRVESWKRRPDEPVRADPAEVDVGVSVPEQVEVVVFYEHAQLE